MSDVIYFIRLDWTGPTASIYMRNVLPVDKLLLYDSWAELTVVISPLRAFLLVEDGVSRDVKIVRLRLVPGESDEPGGGDEGLEVGGGGGYGVEEQV